MTKAKVKPTPQEEVVSPEAQLAEATRLVMEAEQHKQAACMAELEVVLRKFGYSLQTTQVRIILVPTDQGPPP